MSDVVADTHAIVWALSDPTRLSAPALAALTAAQASGRILTATVTLVELTYLVERGRVGRAVLDRLWAAVRDPAEPLEALPLDLGVAGVLDQIPRAVVPDMPDRIIAASALARGLPLVSADGRIQSLAVPGLTIVW